MTTRTKRDSTPCKGAEYRELVETCLFVCHFVFARFNPVLAKPVARWLRVSRGHECALIFSKHLAPVL
jgi:hypothetical protein